MFPKDPGLEYTKGVEPLTVLFLQFPRGFLPPNHKNRAPSGCQARQVERLQDGTPKLPCKDIGREDVLAHFFVLVLEEAPLRMWRPSFL
jgi:hypothetical protein